MANNNINRATRANRTTTAAQPKKQPAASSAQTISQNAASQVVNSQINRANRPDYARAQSSNTARNLAYQTVVQSGRAANPMLAGSRMDTNGAFRTTQERDDLIKEYRQLGWSTPADVMWGGVDSNAARKAEIRDRLSAIDTQLGNPQIDYDIDAVGGTLSGAMSSWAGDKASYYGKTAEGLSNLGQRLGGNTSDYAGWAQDPLSEVQIGMENDPAKYAQQVAEARAIQDVGRRWAEAGQTDIAQAQSGRGIVGRTAVELGANVLQQGLDAAESVLLGGSGTLASLYTRAAGSAMRQAEDEGATIGQQLLYGNAVGGVEAAAEKMFEGLPIYGKGSVDDVVDTAIRKAFKSGAAQGAALVAKDILGEGAEELVSSVADPALKTIYNGKNLKESYDENFNWKDTLHDVAIGGLMGGLGAGTKVMTGGNRSSIRNLQNANEAESQLQAAWGTDKSGKKAAGEYADIIAKQLSGEKLSPKEAAMLESKPTAQETLKNMTADMVNKAFKGAGLTDAQLNVLREGVELSGLDAAEAVTATKIAFEQGKNGKLTVDEVKEQSRLDPTAAEHAYKLGQLQSAAQTVGQRKVGTVTAGEAVFNLGASMQAAGGKTEAKYKAANLDNLSPIQKRTVEMANAVADALPVDIVLFDDKAGPLGAYTQNGKIYLNLGRTLAKGNGVTQSITAATMSHELTHYIQDFATEEYQALRDFVQNNILETNETEFEDLVEQQIRLAKNGGQEMTRDEAINEVVANACQSMLFDSEAINKLASENMTLYEKFLDIIGQIVNKIKTAFNGIDFADENTDIFRAVQAMSGQMDEMQKLWDAGLEAAAKKNVAQKATNEAIAENGVQYQNVTNENDTIRIQTQKAQPELNKMNVVAKVNVTGVPKSVNAAVPWAVDRLKHTGFRVERQNFGRIVFDEGHIREALRHITNHPDEIGAIVALPRVLKRGIIIEQHERHQGRVPDSFTISAPIEVNGARGNMSVVVQRTTKNYYHAHRLLLPDGSNFTFDINEKADSKRTGELPGDRALIAESVETASADNIAETLKEVNTNDEVAVKEVADAKVQFSRAVEDPDTLEFLNDQMERGDVVHTYKTFLVVDGKLYPPMATTQRNENKKKTMANAMEIGRWEESIGNPDSNNIVLVLDKDGNPKVNKKTGNYQWKYKLEKETDSTVPAAYNPYQHSGDLVINDQFDSAYKRDGLYTFECIIPKSELTSGYHYRAPRTADGLIVEAKDPVGIHDWKTGPLGTKLKNSKRHTYLSRWLMPIRQLDNSEVAQMYKDILDKEDSELAVPFNVVTRDLQEELEKIGVPIDYNGSESYQYRRGEYGEDKYPYGTPAYQVAGKNTQSQNIKAGDSTVEVDQKSESVNIQYSRATWEESDYVTERENAAADIAKAIGVTKKKAMDYIDSINSVAKMIADESERLDYEDTGRTPFVSNAEYGGSFDFTTLCKKRRLLTGTFSAIQRALPNTALTANEILEIRKMMDDAGLEVSCGKCYVEGSRASMGTFTKEFIDLYKKYNPGKWAPNMAEMNTPDGIEWVRQTHPEVYEQYEYFWNHYGTLKPGDPNLFASQQKPKLYQMRSAYKGEILTHFKSDGSIEEKNRNGGVRMQSFSDFEIVHLIDAMQVIMDMSRVGLNGQAYTKVPDFAWALGKTGLKINLSIDAWSVDENGKLIFNNKEGMNFDEAMRIRDANSENVGTICCVYDDAQLLAALADDRIDFIIPFHRSQWKKSQYKAMGLPNTTKDYTYQQNEKWLNKNDHMREYRGRMVPVKCTNYMPNEYWDFSKSGKENAEEYLRMCARDGKRPKFYKFLVNNGDGSYSLQPDGSTDGYWKLLIDFKMYDNEGNGSPQMPVKPTFNMEEVNRMLTTYEGGHNTFPTANGIVNEFVQNYKDRNPGKVQFQNYDDVTQGLNFRDPSGELLNRVFDGTKKYETRTYTDKVGNGRIAGAYLNKPMGIVQTGAGQAKRVGYWELGDGVLRDSTWLAEHAAELGNDGTEFEAKPGEKKWVYPIKWATRSDEKPVTSKGIQARRIQFQKWDAEYDTAVESGNVEEQQQLVDQAANAAGYTIKAFHGTRSFGFTVFDPTKADDGISLFATSDQRTAETYSGPTNRNRIKDSETKNADDLHGESLIEEARKHNKRYKSYSLMSDKDKAIVREDAENSIGWSIRRAQEFVRDHRDAFDSDKTYIMDRLISSLYHLRDSETENDISEAWSEWEDALWDLKAIDDSIAIEFLNDVDSRGLFQSKNELDDMTYQGDMYADWYMGGPDYIFDQQLQIELNAEYHKGIYELWCKPGKQLQIDSTGENWNQITPPKELRDYGLYGPQRTRDIASAAKALGYDSVLLRGLRDNGGETAYNGASDVYIFFDASALKSADPVTYDDNGKAIPLSARFNEGNNDIRFQNWDDSVFAEPVSAFDAAQEGMARERARADKRIAEIKAHDREVLINERARRNESASVSKYRKKVQQKAGDLYEMLMTNSDKQHVPEHLKQTVGEFLKGLDFTSKRALAGGVETKADQAFGARIRDLEKFLSNQQKYIEGENVEGDYDGYLDISGENLDYLRNVSELIDMAAKENRNFTINDMTGEELKQLSNFISNLNTAIRNTNRFMANARYETVKEAASNDYNFLQRLGKASEKAGNALRSLVSWKNGTPYYIAKRFGEGGKAVFDGLSKGWEKMAFNAKEIIDFTKKAYTTKEVNEWKNTVHDITLDDGSKVQMTTAQIMELSMLLGREQALKHIEAGGIRIGTIQTKKGQKNDTNHYHLTLKDIENITGLLTERQAEVAKNLQQFMAKRGAEWGNEVSMRRFGYNFYTEGEGYYPIKTDANDRPMADTDAQNNSMFRLLNLSSSKSLNPKANNALVVGDIFDTFSDHMADMAKLNGMGLPILDAIKWFNYKEKIDNGDGTFNTRTLQSALEEAYGSDAGRYFRTLIKDINGQTESGDRGANFMGKLMSNYKLASVGANLRVAFLQPTSYVRALIVLKPQFLAGVAPSKAAYQEALKYSGTAVWKSLGYYDTDISKSMRGQIAHADTVRDKIAEASMVLAEKGDQLTWSMLWTACKRQTAAETGLKGEELNQATADLFREAIYSSQVMDSTLTRSEIMRGKTMTTKAASAFMAEPTVSFNILMDAVSQFKLDERENGKAGAWQRNSGKIGKAFSTYLLSAATAALVESIADALRDDDDEEFSDKFLDAFFGEDGKFLKGNLAQDLTILGKIPYVKNFISTLQGYQSGDMSATAFNNLVNTYKIWEETVKLNFGLQDKATKVTYYGKMTPWGKVYKTLQSLSQISGVAVSNATRDAVALWNSTAGTVNPDMKIRTYDNPEERRTNALVDALLSGNKAAVKDAVAEFDSSKEAYNAAKGALKEQFMEGDFDSAEVTSLLKDAGGRDKDVASTVKKLGFEKQHGFSYDELKQQFIAGNISRSDTISALRKVGGKTVEEVNKILSDYDFAAKHEDEYGEYGLSVSQARPWYEKYKGKVTLEQYADQIEEYGTTKVKDYYDEWKPATGMTIEQYDSYKSTAPLYGDEKKIGAYNVWKAELRNTMSLDRYISILKAADLDANGSLKQDELGARLLQAIENGEMTYEQAYKIWHSQGWTKEFDVWAKKRKK